MRYTLILSVFISLTFLVLKPCISQNTQIVQYTTEDGLPQDNLTQLMFDNNDKLWIGTQGGLCIFDGKKIQNLINFRFTSRVHYIHKDRNQNLFILDDKGNIFQNNYNNYKIDKINFKSETYENWFISSDVGDTVIELSEVNKHIYFYTHHLGYKNFKNFAKNGTLYFIKYDKAFENLESYFFMDTFLIGLTKDGKLFKNIYNEDQQEIKSTLPLDLIRKGLIFNSDAGTFCLYEKTIFRFHLYQNHLSATAILKNVELDPVTDQIHCAQYNSKTQVFYFGSTQNGLYEVKPTLFNIIRSNTFHLDPLFFTNGHAYYSQLEIDSSAILVNNYIVLNGNKNTTGKTPKIHHPFNRAANMIDDKGWIWYADGEFMIRFKGAVKTKISLKPLSYPILSICKASGERYFHLHYHNIIETDTSKELRRLNLKPFLTDNYEYGQYIYYDKLQNILYLLTNKNIYTVDIENDQISPVTTLQEADYRIMTSLNDTMTFIGTYGQGFLLKVDNQFYDMPLDNKGYLKFAHTALVDEHGHVWISTNNGLFRTRLEDMKAYLDGKVKDIFYYYYDKKSGFLTNEFNGGCQSPAIKLKDGRFSFSSMDGLVQFDPMTVPAYFPTNAVKIVELTLNGKLQDTIPTSLSVSQDINDIKLEVSTAYYGHPDNLVIQYRIPGYVDEWKDLDDKRYITLQNAGYGSFAIEIRKRNGFGPDAYDYTTYPVTMLPYFYQTWWFISIAALTGIGFLIVFAKWYTYNLNHQKIKLEALIRERNQTLIHTNIELEEKIRQNEMFHSVMVHDIKAPIHFIGTISNEILLGLERLTLNEIKSNLETVKQAAFSINTFVIDFLTWTKYRVETNQFDKERVSINEIMTEIINFHVNSDKVKRGRLSIVNDCQPNVALITNKQLLKIVLNNLLSNSIKFSHQGTITLYAYYSTKKTIIIGCKDEGKGMDSKLITLLTDKHYKGNSIREDSFRMGYVFINDIIKILNAQIYIQSEIGKGTDVAIELNI
ncbi:MAG TPA: ATP-binding protein [Saprospiraceae bacterium]|nr:ATP-binding protein [Saprospiraceae bacterium]